MNDPPSLAELKALAAIARHRSFRKAADELDMAPSTISHMMSVLEARIGTRLLNRTTRSVLPTEAGERLVARLRPILQDLDDALAEIEAARDQPRGCALLEEWCPAYPGLFLYYPGHRQTPAGLRAFVDVLKATAIN
jgi:DNA-binding transcriptional LysR family regulator